MNCAYSKLTGKFGLRCQLYSAVLFAVAQSVSQGAQALPQGGDVVSGSAVIIDGANELTVDQASDRVIIDYQSFDIGADERVQFIQPSSTSVALNRVVGNDLSNIAGQLDANGRVFLINTNGVVFGEGAQIDVGSLLVSTLDVTNEDFASGRLELNGTGGSIQNYGVIHAAEGVYLVAPELVNDGTINAPEAALISGHSVLVQPQGSQIAVLLDGPDALGSLQQNGTINAERALLALQSGVEGAQLHNDGLVRATAATLVGGSIELLAPNADILQGGYLEAHAGDITITADRYAQTGVIDAAGVGSSDGGNVAITTDDTIVIHPDALIDASAEISGDGGEVVLYSADATWYRENAVIHSRGGALSGDGGFVEVSGRNYINVQGLVDVGASNGSSGLWYIDPSDITINNGGVNEDGFVGSNPYTWDLGDSQQAQIDIDTIMNTLENLGDVFISTASGEALVGDIEIEVDIPLDAVPAGRSLTLNANNNITFSENVNIQDAGGANRAFNLTLNAGGAIDFGNNNVINVGTGSFSANAGGDITVGDITSNNAASDLAISLVAGGAILEDMNAATQMRGSGGMFLSAYTGIGLNGSLSIGTARLGLELNGPFDFTLNMGGGSPILTGFRLVSGSGINVSSVDDIQYSGTLGSELDGALNSSITLSSTSGSIYIDGDLGDTQGAVNNATTMDFTANSGIWMSDGVSINAGDANVTLTSISGGSSITGLASLSNADSAITLNINSGNITDSGDTNPIDIYAPNGGIEFNLQDSVTELEIDARIIDVFSSGGGVALNDVNDVTIGSLDVATTATIVAVNDLLMDSTSSLASNDLVLVAGGSVNLGSLTADNVQVTAGGNISDANGEALNLTGSTAILDADGNIGLLDALDAELSTLSISAGGSAVLRNSSALTIDSIHVIGDFDITVDSGNLSIVESEPRIGGDAAINLPAGDLVVNPASLNFTNDLMLTATGVRDTDGQARIDAGDATITLLDSANGLDLIVDFDRLTLDAQGSQAVTITDVDALEVTYLSAAADLNLTSTTQDLLILDSAPLFGGSLSLTALGQDVVVPDLGLSVAGDLTIASAGAIRDSDNTLNLNAAGLSVSTNSAVETVFNTAVDSLALNALGGGSQIFNEADDVTLVDIASGGSFTAAAVSGDITVTDTLINVAGITSLTTQGDGDIVLAATGLNVAGDLLVNAADFSTGSNLVSISANNADITVRDGGLASIWNTTINSLAMNYAGTSSVSVNNTAALTVAALQTGGDATINTAGDLTLVPVAPSVMGDLSINNVAGGILRVNDSGLSVANHLAINSAAIVDSDNQVVLNSDTAAVTLTDLNQATQLNTQFNSVQFDVNGAAVSVNHNGPLTLTGLSASDAFDLSTTNVLTVTADTLNTSATVSLNSAANQMVIMNTGLTTGGDLNLVASDIVDGDGAITLNAVATSLQLADALAVNLDGSINQLALDAANATDVSVVNDTALELVQWDLAQVENIVFDVAGSLTLLSAGLISDDSMSITATDLFDDDRTFTLSTTDLLLNLSAPAGDVVLNTQTQNLDALIGGNASLSVMQTGHLNLVDLNGDNQAINVNDGNLSVNINNGDLAVEADVVAADLTADSVREGNIQLVVSNGDMTVGANNTLSNPSVAITSSNNVDQALISDSVQSGVSLQLLGTEAQDRTITLGNGANNVVITAIGSDVDFNIRAPGTPDENARALVQNEGAIISTYNQVSDPLTGIAEVNGIAIVPDENMRIGEGRRFNLTATYEFPTDYLEVIEPVENVAEPVIGDSEPGRQVNVQFVQVFGQCNESDVEDKQRCRIESALKSFLSHWLIGGELPPRTEI